MPIYEYLCSSCGFQKEYLQKVSDPLLSVCPECNKVTFGKMLTAAGFQLKGGGWYATDFKNSGARPAPKTEGQSETAGKSESKTATTGESKGDGRGDGRSDGRSDGRGDGNGDGRSERKSDGKTKAQPVAAAASVAAANASKAE